jgi:PAS domain S-box-containing protein
VALLGCPSTSINFQRRIDGFIGNSLQHFHYFCQQTDLPLMVTTEQTLLESGLSVSDSNFIAALYSFAKAFQAHAFALYYVDNSRGQDALRYVYDKTIDGLMRIDPDHHQKNKLLRLNQQDFFDELEAVPIGSFPPTFRQNYQLSLQNDGAGQTSVIFALEYVTPLPLPGVAQGERIASFIIHKSLDPLWQAFSEEFRLGFGVFDTSGMQVGGNITFEDSSFSAPDQSHGVLRVMSDHAQISYDTFVSSIVYDNKLIGYVAIGIPRSETQQKLLKAVFVFLGIAGVILLFFVTVSTFFISYTLRPIHELIKSTKLLASGDWNHPVKIQGRDEISILAHAFNQMLKDLRLKTTSIDNLKKAEEALHEESFRRRILFEQSRDGIVILDENGKVYEASQSYADMLGYTMDECRKLHIWDWDTQWSPEELLKMLQQVDATGDHFVTGFRRKDKTYIDAEISSNGVTINGKKFVSCICRDITNRKRMEKEITDTNERLQKALAEKNKFFSIIAHDLKSPLAGFLSLTRMLAENHAEFSADEIKEILFKIKDSAETVYQLLENLLQWALVQRGRHVSAPESCYLSVIVQHNLELIVAQARQKDIRIEHSIPEGAKVYADHQMLNTVFRNLLSNAVKFTKRGGSILISAVQEGTMVRISVQDSGVGMSQDALSLIFAIDQKASTPGTDGERGTGLGLILCKEFIEILNGRIWVESKVDHGTTFHFTLPAQES